jgi:hypothetical protein
MAVINGTNGELRWNGQKIAKVRDVTMEKSRATLETTGIGDLDDTYSYGKRSTSGSATLLYDPEDTATVQLLNRILNDGESPDELSMVLRRGSSQGTISGSVLIASQGTSVSVGDNVSVSISFVFSGKPTGTF